jgi:hypothetical protein
MSLTDEVVMSRPTKDPLRLVANTAFSFPTREVGLES